MCVVNQVTTLPYPVGGTFFRRADSCRLLRTMRRRCAVGGAKRVVLDSAYPELCPAVLWENATDGCSVSGEGLAPEIG